MTIRVVIVDDHPLIVEGLRGALGQAPGLDIVGTAGSVEEARRLIGETSPDIVLSTFLTTQYVNAAIALGASGFLLKTTPTAQILGAIQDVVGGKLAFSAEQLRSSWRAGWTPLTARERDIIAGVMAGRSNDELSGSLSISRKTVEAYLSRLFDRFGVVTRTELAVLAEREQWLALPIARTGRNPGVRP